MSVPKDKKRKRSNIILVLLIISTLGFGAAFFFNLGDAINYWRDGRDAQAQTEIMQDIFAEQIDEVISLIAHITETPEADHAPEPWQGFLDGSLLDEVRELTENPDIVAYITIPGTQVGNAVVQGTNNAFYLNHDIFRRRNVNGALFMDYRNTPDFTNPNTIIYGHNMNNGTKFHNLRFYMQQEFFENHPHIVVITDYAVFIYEIFSTFSTRVDFDYIQVHFYDREEFGELVDEINRRAVFETGITADSYDRILILSTCTNVRVDMRYVVAGRLAHQIER
ncbi:MAG: class B sortase [Defluviitaleaceae bacterium]|nr:class B sortase [Defluviitaleaceae bacterium]